MMTMTRTMHGRGTRARTLGLGLAVILALVAARGPASARSAHAAAPQGGPPVTTVAAADWPSYGNDLGGMRYQNVDQITPANVARLKPAWIFHTTVMSKLTSFEAQPIEVGGTLYVSGPHDHVFALDAASGALKWTYNPDLPPLNQLAICCGQVNRGVAVGGGKVFIAQLDATLVALDARTGKAAWRTTIADWRQDYTETVAPLYVDGKVIVGISGGELMKRGFVTAYDAQTGKLLWRFYTVPDTLAFGHDTWSGPSWQTGGGTVWVTPNVDPGLGLVYVNVGNAAPNLNGSQRAGTNLFTASLVALDLNTGKLRWYFQEVHHDLWDYDLAQPSIIFTLYRNGQAVPAIANAEKDGYFFVLDRRTGTPLYPVKEMPVSTQPAWQHASPTQPVPATQPLIPQSVTSNPTGLPSGGLFTLPREQPTVIQPGFESGPEWGSGAYSPRTKYAYIPAGGYEPWIYHAMPNIINSLGSTGTGVKAPGIQEYGLFDAVDTTTGKIAWRFKTKHKTVTGTVVAGDLVFWGQDDGRFDAMDARTGQLLWAFQSSAPGFGGANGSPAVYVVNGREYVVMAFGGNFRERADSTAKDALPGDALVAFALPRAGYSGPSVVTAHPQPVPEVIPRMIPPASSAPTGARVVTIHTHDFHYYPNTFTVTAGQQVAVHIVNTGALGASIAFTLPGGAIALSTPVKPGRNAYLVFTAPRTPGAYTFFSPLGPQKFFGMTGTMTVGS